MYVSTISFNDYLAMFIKVFSTKMLAKNLNLKIQTLQLEIDVEKIQMASSVILQFIVYLTNEKFILQLTLKRSIWGQARGLRRKLEDSLKQSKIKRNVFFYNFFHAYIAMFKKVFSTKMFASSITWIIYARL